MEPMFITPQHDESKEYRIYIALTIGVLIVLVIVVAHIMLSDDNTTAFMSAIPAMRKLQPVASPTIDPARANLTLVTGSGENRLRVDTSFTININAFSQEESVGGYDVLLQYDPAALELESAKSAKREFQIFQGNLETGGVYITGTKDFAVTDKTPFNGDAVLTLTFKPKKTGATVLTLLPTSGVKKSKLVTDAVKVLVPQLQGMRVEIY